MSDQPLSTILTPMQEQQAMQEYVRRRKQAYRDWYMQAPQQEIDETADPPFVYNPDIAKRVEEGRKTAGYAEDEKMPPQPGRLPGYSAVLAEQEMVQNEPRRDQALDDALAYKDLGHYGPLDPNTHPGELMPTLESGQDKLLGQPISDQRLNLTPIQEQLLMQEYVRRRMMPPPTVQGVAPPSGVPGMQIPGLEVTGDYTGRRGEIPSGQAMYRRNIPF